MSTTRNFLLLALLTSAAAAEEPLITATGARLGDFAVRVNLADVDRATPEALVSAYARFQTEQRAVADRFSGLYAGAHLEILGRYYAPPMVAAQRKAYDQHRLVRDYRCTVGKRDGNTFNLVRAWKDGDTDIRRAMRVVVGRDRGAWVILRILDRQSGNLWKERSLGVPPKVAPAMIPAAPEADRTSPRATVESLRRAMARLQAIRLQARHQLDRHFFTILGAFFGPALADEKRRAQQLRPKLPRIRFEFTEEKNRVLAVLWEQVPGMDRRSALADMAFDLEEAAAGWRIHAEWRRPKPGAPFEPVRHNFGAVFLTR